MLILGIITPNAKARNIGTQMKVFYENGLPNKASLFYMTLPIDITPQTYAVQQFDHVFENVPNEEGTTQKVGLIELTKIFYSSKDGAVQLENKRGAGYLYFPDADIKEGTILEIWTQELTAFNGDIIQVEIPDGKMQLTGTTTIVVPKYKRPSHRGKKKTS